MNDLPLRPRLVSRLDGALARRLTVLVADTGFGKTTLLRSWTAGINAVVHPVAARDAELTRLWRRLVATLRTHLPDLPEEWTSGAARGPVSAHSESVRPQAMAELLAEALAERLARDLVLVLDDAHRVADGPAASFLAGLVRHAPPLLHVVLTSRGPVPVPAARLHAQGELLEISGAELAFTSEEVAALLAAVAGEDTTGLAGEIRAATGGWPIAVRLAVEALRDLPPDQQAGWLTGLPGGQLGELLGAIHAQEPAPVRRLLATMTLFDRFPAELGEALGLPGASGVLAGLTHRGLFVEPTGQDEYRLHPLARRFLAEQTPLPAAEATRVRRRAADWFAGHDRAHTALRLLVAAGEPGRVAALLAAAGERLADGGHADAVAEAVAALPAGHRAAEVERLAGHSHLVRGDWDEALACYARAAGDPADGDPADGDSAAGGSAAGAGTAGATARRLAPALAWRIGMVHYLRGEHDQALATYDRADTAGPATPDLALLLAWTAATHWVRDDAKTCGELATRALRIADRVGDPAALAASHTVLSMLAALEGDRRGNAAHYEQALRYATQAGDVLQLIRIHNNRASHSMEEGDYGPALAELAEAVRLADLHGYGAFGALALSNRAEIRLRLGRLEEAHHDITTALAILRGHGSRKAAYPLTLLGHLHHLRGDGVAAVRAFQQALEQVASSGDRQALVLALAGLAPVLAADEPERARDLADQAVSDGEGMGQVAALLAAARVAAAAGDPDLAASQARAARETAQARRDRAGVAEAYEIEAAVMPDRARARELARTAVAGWVGIGDPVGRARAELVLAERLDDAVAAAAVAAATRERMLTIGCRLLAARADAVLTDCARSAQSGHSGHSANSGHGARSGHSADSAHSAHSAGAATATDRPVRVETLGGFRVARGRTVLPATAWRSHKARDLLKILVARRGRPATRDFLMETLWPGQPPAALANRLHVAVSTLRSTLDPDRQFDTDTFVVTDDDAVRIRLERVAVDVESFLDDAVAGLALVRSGLAGEALPRLARAEGRYTGNFLEENLYDDWAVPVREQARTAYLEVAACLAQHAEAAGEVDTAARYLLRILEHDPYDERAHLRLVTALARTGRHGDARRHYRHYCTRMDELEVEAAPFPRP